MQIFRESPFWVHFDPIWPGELKEFMKKSEKFHIEPIWPEKPRERF